MTLCACVREKICTILDNEWLILNPLRSIPDAVTVHPGKKVMAGGHLSTFRLVSFEHEAFRSLQTEGQQREVPSDSIILATYDYSFPERKSQSWQVDPMFQGLLSQHNLFEYGPGPGGRRRNRGCSQN